MSGCDNPRLHFAAFILDSTPTAAPHRRMTTLMFLIGSARCVEPSPQSLHGDMHLPTFFRHPLSSGAAKLQNISDYMEWPFDSGQGSQLSFSPQTGLPQLKFLMIKSRHAQAGSFPSALPPFVFCIRLHTVSLSAISPRQCAGGLYTHCQRRRRLRGSSRRYRLSNVANKPQSTVCRGGECRSLPVVILQPWPVFAK